MKTFILPLLFLLVGCTGSKLPPAPTPDPWLAAVQEGQDIMQQAPDFEQHLVQYQTIAADINYYLDAVEQTRPALDTIDDLRQTDLPLGGNAWGALTRTLDKYRPGMGLALEALDDLLRQLLALRGQLKTLDNLAPVADAARAFRADPNRETLLALEQAASAEISTLENMLAQLDEPLARLDEVLGGLEMLQRGLLSDVLADMPVVGPAVQPLAQGLDDLVAPLQELQSSGRQFSAQIQSDLQVARHLRRTVETAQNPPAVTAEVSARPAAGGPGGQISLVPIFLIVLVIAAVVTVALKKSGSLQPTTAGAASVAIAPAALPPAVSSKPVASQPSPVRAALYAQTGPLAGQSFPLTGDDVLIGRGSACQVRVSDKTVSRQHLRLRLAQGEWFAQDQNSSTGTLVNNRPVTATRLQDGDSITIGSTTLALRLG